MRRAHLEVVPAFLRFYGLKPWDLQWLSPLELNECIDWMRKQEG